MASVDKGERMPAEDLDRIAVLLTCEALDKQVAAAIVLGEIGGVRSELPL